MLIQVADEAHDKWQDFIVTDVKREGQSLVIVTGPLSFIVAPFEEFSEKIIDLVGDAS
jgi:hypothetical protein